MLIQNQIHLVGDHYLTLYHWLQSISLVFVVKLLLQSPPLLCTIADISWHHHRNCYYCRMHCQLELELWVGRGRETMDSQVAQRLSSRLCCYGSSGLHHLSSLVRATPFFQPIPACSMMPSHGLTPSYCTNLAQLVALQHFLRPISRHSSAFTAPWDKSCVFSPNEPFLSLWEVFVSLQRFYLWAALWFLHRKGLGQK